MQVARADMAVTMLNDGRVLVTGGSVDDDPTDSQSSYPGGDVVDKVDIFDPQSGTWTPAASMPTPRRFHQAVLLPDGRVLVLGGQEYDDRQYVPSQHLFDPSTNTWTTAPGFSPSGAVVALADGRVLADDGYHIVTYSPADGTQGRIGEQYNFDSTGHSAATATTLADGTVLFTHSDGGAVRVDVAADTVTVLPKYDTPNVGVSQRAATLLDDGTVLIAGGSGFVDSSQPNHAVAEVERFDPATNTWMATPDMPNGRRGPLAARLNDGTVLIAGGWAEPFWEGGPSFLFDPVANAWSTTSSLPGLYGGTGYRFTQAGTALADGTVLMVGGYGQGGFLDSAIRYVIDTDVPSIAFGPGTRLRALTLQNVRGTAADATSGVASVLVRGTPLKNTAEFNFAYTAALECDDASQRSCTWDAGSRIPSGYWHVEAIVTDRAGNSTSVSMNMLGPPV